MNEARQMIINGTMLIAVMDYGVYESFAAQKDKLFVPLSEYLEEVPEYAYDDYSLKFKEIPYVEFSDVFDPIANETVIVLIRPTWTSSLSSNEAKERYLAHEELMKKLVAFTLG